MPFTDGCVLRLADSSIMWMELGIKQTVLVELELKSGTLKEVLSVKIIDVLSVGSCQIGLLRCLESF
ncbi:hypothetical protein PS1_001704 [Malus domestica]